MPISFNSNINSQSAIDGVNSSNKALQQIYARISSGLQTQAGANAADVAASIKLTTQIEGLSQAQRNASDAISLSQVAEGALTEVTDIFQRGRELALQSANATYSATDRKAIQSEFNQLQQQLKTIVDTTEFNGEKLFQSGGLSLDFQLGAQANQTVSVDLKNPIEDFTNFDLSTAEGAQAAIGTFDNALDEVSIARSDLGAVQSRFSSAVKSLSIAQEGLEKTRSQIADADIAKESADLVKNQILNQASIAVLAQANANKLGALALLQTAGKS